METEFKHLSFDQIRYSMVWEGAASLVKGLQPDAHDHLLIITSAGCNVLNMLLEDCASVTAIDLNPLQNKLLVLKGMLIRDFPYEVYAGLLGFDGEAGMKKAVEAVLPVLSAPDRSFWQPIFEANSRGLLLAGRLETYINNFRHQLSEEQQRLMQGVFEAKDLQDQTVLFEKVLQTDFRTRFVAYFDRQQLSKGRDPRLFRFTKDPGGESFFFRLQRYMKQHLLRDSFISHFFFFGPAHIPMELRPPAYQIQNYRQLATAWSKLQVHTGEAIDFLFSEAGKHITKASLSNIFEYTSPEIFEQTVGVLLQNRQQPITFMYWNLLNDQGGNLLKLPAHQTLRSQQLSAEEDCFYFDSVHLFNTNY